MAPAPQGTPAAHGWPDAEAMRDHAGTIFLAVAVLLGMAIGALIPWLTSCL